MLVNKRKNKRYIIGTLVFACVSLMIIVALTFSYMCEVCNNAIESVTEILLREQAVNDSIASMISTSTMSHMNTKCESKELLGALYTNRNFDTQSCSKINAVTFVENYLSKKTLQNRY
ncbi:GGDEF domain-containing protein, partial [Cronobacter malonaticus]|nr:GGDEF domain-containing protein [Cronobacter malonaticus]